MSDTTYIGVLKLLLVIFLVGYCGLVLFALLFANRLIFPAPPAGYRDSPDIIKFPYDEKGRSVAMVFLENPDSRYLVFYHHGNGEDLQGILPRLEALRQMGFAVLAWDYPGYGTSEGSPSEKSVLRAAGRIWESIPEQFNYRHDQVILYGRSLGGGPAIDLSARYEPAGLVLEGVFTSIFRVGLPFNFLPWDIFDNLKRIEKIQCPVLFLHGTEDRTVPFAHAERLFEKAPQPKTFSWFSDTGHNDILESYPEIYYSSLDRFREVLDNRKDRP